MHMLAAIRYQRFGRGLGATSAALAAFVGGSVFATLSAESTNTALQVATGVVSIIASLLVAVITFMGFGATSEKHHQSANAWGDVVHQLELLRGRSFSSPQLVGELTHIRTAMTKISNSEPVAPDKCFDKAEAWVTNHPESLVVTVT
jgi:hypothetical protein